MRIIILIFIFINQFCLGQQVCNRNSIFDSTKFNYFNVFSSQKTDSSYDNGNNLILTKIFYNVYSSLNSKYFLEVYDTAFNCDECSGHSHILFYKANKLIWDEYSGESIDNIYFFENSGSCIIKKMNPFYSSSLFYDSIGNVIEKFSEDDQFDYLGVNEVIKWRLRGDYLYLTILNSKDEIQYSDSILHQDYNVYPYESGNGLFILRSSKDTLYSFDNRFRLLWKKPIPRTDISFSYSGKYFIVDVLKAIEENKTYRLLYYELYDNQTGSLIKRIGEFNLNGKTFDGFNVHFVHNSDLLVFSHYDKNDNKTYITFCDVNGFIVKSVSYNQIIDSYNICLKRNYMQIFNKDKLIDEFYIK